jgi:hypothetical protein
VGGGELAAIFRGLVNDATQVGQKIAASVARLAERTADIEEADVARLLEADRKAADDIADAGGRSTAGVGFESDGSPHELDLMGRKFDRPWERPKAPARIPDDHLPAGDPVYHGSYSTAIGYDSFTMSNFDRAKPEPGFHDAVVHGEPDGTFLPGLIGEDGANHPSNPTHPNQIADAIRNNPNYTGGPVRLVSCHSGTVDPDAGVEPAAQGVADSLGVPVLAPTGAVGVERHTSGPQVPTIRDNGKWLMFYPRNGR